MSIILQIISAITDLLMVIIAYLALSNWKKELKAEKEYKVYKNVYKFLLSLQEKIQYIEEYYKEVDDDGELEDDINNKIGQYFKKNLELIKSLKLDLMGLNDTNYIIPYFLEKFKKYSAKISDRPGWGVQAVWDSEGSVREIDPYEKSFYEDFLGRDENNNKKILYVDFQTKIKEGLAYFKKKIQKFFK